MKECSLYATYQYEVHGEMHRYFMRIGKTSCAQKLDAVVGYFYSAILNHLVPVVTLSCEPRETIFTEVKKSCVN